MYCICISVINPFPVLLDCGNEVCFGCKFLCLFWNNYGSIIRMLPWKKINWNISFKYSHCIKDYSMWLLLFNFTMCHGHVRKSYHQSGPVTLAAWYDWQWMFRNPWGLVICELRTGELVICEPIVRTTDANLEYNANHKVRTFYAIKRGQYTCLCIRNAEMTFITIQNAERNQLVYMLQKYHKTTRVRCGGNYLHYTGPTYMPNQRSVVSALRAVGNL